MNENPIKDRSQSGGKNGPAVRRQGDEGSGGFLLRIREKKKPRKEVCGCEVEKSGWVA